MTFLCKPDYTETTSYRPVSLSSCLLKMMEKLVYSHIRNDVLRNCPLHRNQFSYQVGKYTRTRLHVII
jgi:hypothetical protein